MQIFDLPTCLEVNGTFYDILSDYRDAIQILTAFEDPDLSEKEKLYVCLYDLYPAFMAEPEDGIPPMPAADYEAAYLAAVRFLDGGQTETADRGDEAKRLMDWAQDAPLLFAAVNRVAGGEVRSLDYLHWWTFLGYFMEIRDGVFSTVLSLRRKKYIQHKKFEKEEDRFWRENRRICELRKRVSASEQAETAAAKAVLEKFLNGAGQGKGR